MIAKSAASVFQAARGLIFPARCAVCRRIVDEKHNLLCPDCYFRLPFCACPLPLEDVNNTIAASAFFYEEPLRGAFLRYKFSGKDFYSDLFSPFIADAVTRQLPGQSFDIVTWVPLSRQHLRKRGYDQARLFAEQTARLLSLPCEPLLRKTKNTRTQSGLSDREARARNVAGVYEPALPERISGRKLLLIDDVLTTGSTLRSAADTLYRSGAASVSCAVLARHRPD